jgi:hypothetical protein
MKKHIITIKRRSPRVTDSIFFKGPNVTTRQNSALNTQRINTEIPVQQESDNITHSVDNIESSNIGNNQDDNQGDKIVQIANSERMSFIYNFHKKLNSTLKNKPGNVEINVLKSLKILNPMNVSNKNYTLIDIYSHFSVKNWILDKQYQRFSWNWDANMQNALLDTILCSNIPLPPLILHKQKDDNDNDTLVKYIIDGRHRIETITWFLNNKLTWIVFDETGKKFKFNFSDLTTELQNKFLEREWAVTTITCTNDEAHDIFLKYNQQQSLNTAQRLYASKHSIIQIIRKDESFFKDLMDTLFNCGLAGYKVEKFELICENSKESKAFEVLFDTAIRMCLIAVLPTIGKLINASSLLSSLESIHPSEEQLNKMFRACKLFINCFKTKPCNIATKSEAYAIYGFLYHNFEKFEKNQEHVNKFSQWYSDKFISQRNNFNNDTRIGNFKFYYDISRRNLSSKTQILNRIGILSEEWNIHLNPSFKRTFVYKEKTRKRMYNKTRKN